MPNVARLLGSALKGAKRIPKKDRVPGLLSYSGSKEIEANRLLSSLSDSGVAKIGNRMIEPFAGSAAFTRVAAKKKMIEGAILGDTNPRTVNILRNVQRHPDLIADSYYKFASGLQDTKVLGPGDIPYVKRIVQKLKNDEFIGVDAAAADLFVGRYAVGHSPGKAPFLRPGYKTDMNPEQVSNLVQDFSSGLRGADIKQRDYKTTLGLARPGDFLVADPPYIGTRNYTGVNTQSLLGDILKDLDSYVSKRKGIHGLLYNSALGTKVVKGKWYDTGAKFKLGERVKVLGK